MTTTDNPLDGRGAAWRTVWLSVDVLDRDGHCVGGGIALAGDVLDGHHPEYQAEERGAIERVATGAVDTASLGRPASHIIRRACAEELHRAAIYEQAPDLAPTVPANASRYGGRNRLPVRVELLWEELTPRQRRHITLKTIPACHPSNIPANPSNATWGVLEAEPGSLNMSIGENNRRHEIQARERRAQKEAR